MSRFILVATACVAIGDSLFGYDAGVLSGAILFVRDTFGLGPLQIEMVVGAAIVGAMLGAVGSGPLVDRFGRRTVLLAAAAVFSVGELASALAVSASMLIGARLLLGVAIGASSYTAPLYISEVAPPQYRGRLVGMSQLAVTGGILVGNLIDVALAGSGVWRLMLALAVLPALVLFVGVFALPDTPRWLVWHGRIEKAREVLQRVLGREDVDAELKALQTGVAQEGRANWADVLRPDVRRPLFIGIGLAIFQQLTGINAIIYYAPTLIQGAGVPSAAGAILATVGIGGVNVLMTVIAILLLDRVGRRPLLLASLGGVAFTLAVLGSGFHFAATGAPTGLATLTVVSLMAYVGAFAVGLGPVFWLLIAEIFPMRVRALSMGLATAANWAANLLVASTFLTLVERLGQSTTFWIYALVALVALVFAFELVPETRGRTLEEIERQWGAEKSGRSHAPLTWS